MHRGERTTRMRGQTEITSAKNGVKPPRQDGRLWDGGGGGPETAELADSFHGSLRPENDEVAPELTPEARGFTTADIQGSHKKRHSKGYEKRRKFVLQHHERRLRKKKSEG